LYFGQIGTDSSGSPVRGRANYGGNSRLSAAYRKVS
jgi:hypothetical protein